MSTPLVSFVVLSYNYARYIDQCIASILAQQGDHQFEIIVVDDASTDNSDEVIRSFADPRIHYIRHEVNQGHAATVTDGLRAARGKFVARIDSDDRYRSSFLNTVLPKFEQYPDVGLVYGDAAVIDDRGMISAERTDLAHDGRDYKGSEFVKLLRSNFICAPTVIARREAWLRALPIPQWLVFHDWYFTLMIGRHHPFYFCADVLADYRVHNANYHSRIVKEKSEEASIIGFLDLLYGSAETDPQMEAEKRAARKEIYAEHYRLLASKYFWFHHNADARRCFWNAIRLKPSLLTDPVTTRQFAATVFGRGLYERLKAARRA